MRKLIKENNLSSKFDCLFLFTKIVGVAVSIPLMIQLIDEKNLFAKNVCTSNTPKSKINCSSILNSPAANFLGIFSWSEIGFIYFITLFFYILLFQVHAIALVAGLAVLLAAYMLYSIYYLWKVVRQWCHLCLMVQVILFLNLILTVAFFSLLSPSPIQVSVQSIFVLILVFAVIISFYSLLKSILIGWKSYEDKFQSLLNFLSTFNFSHHEKVNYKKVKLHTLVVFVLLLGACSEEETSDILPLTNENMPIEEPLKEAPLKEARLKIEGLTSRTDYIVASNGKTTITVPIDRLTSSNTYGPFTANGTLTKIKTNQSYFVPSGAGTPGLAAAYYLCDVWESEASVTIPSGAFIFNYSAATEGFISPNITANNVMNTPQGTSATSYATSVGIATYSVVPMYDVLGRYIYNGTVLPRNLPNNNTMTYYYFVP